ncbi:hypothetical protein [Microbacterium sp.]|uniref:hypothetical protein n=1 Tax=Microbacterium sp. TaxID=51671 RepID=UPI00333EC3A2
MDWSRQRIFGIVAGGVLGALLGLTVMSAWFPRGIILLPVAPLVILGITLSNLGVSQSMVARIEDRLVERSRMIAGGAIQGEPAIGRIRRLYPRQRTRTATLLLPGAPEPGRLASVRVIPAGSAPRDVYALFPERYGIVKGAPAAVLLDAASPDISVLDDRVTPETLAAIDRDPRWQTTTSFVTMYKRQGGNLVIIAALIGLAVGIAIGIAMAQLLG